MAKEICYIMLGKKKPYYVRGKLVKKTIGNVGSVVFDWQWALNREEKRGDIIGFWHTHPDGSLKPSKRDIKTMQAWVSCFGKPLLCVIQDSRYKTAYLVRLMKHEKWEFAWLKQILVRKISRRFGIFT